MDNFDFVEKMQEIMKIIDLPDGKSTFHIPVGLRDLLIYIKEKRDNRRNLDNNELLENMTDESEIEDNIPMPACLSIERDAEGYAYVLFDDDNGNPLAIIQNGGIRYRIKDREVIFCPEFALENYVLDFLEKVHVKDFKELMNEIYKTSIDDLKNSFSYSIEDNLVSLKNVQKKMNELEAEKIKREDFISYLKMCESTGMYAARAFLIWILGAYARIMEEVKSKKEEAAAKERNV